MASPLHVVIGGIVYSCGSGYSPLPLSLPWIRLREAREQGEHLNYAGQAARYENWSGKKLFGAFKSRSGCLSLRSQPRQLGGRDGAGRGSEDRQGSVVQCIVPRGPARCKRAIAVDLLSVRS